ncbi:glycosyltransferase family 4 protein [Mucilaginibacter sp. JRF]|uniref:glycosyltransferase family 4 protein n=1 Tax=Mucilaginibacter sp. JRF TaxID=2780088 RepID=UPI001882DD01|nr:glycosyltransferase family 4 protein [Mucilaginibacter sp. JRF]MBE9585875.1 glycosyltransferase family 4 protein [Mucilaginibacter sp. JRF]
MRVLISNTYYYPAFVGGAEISVKLLAEGMAAKGNQVYVLATGLKDSVYRVGDVIVITVKQQNIFNSYDKTPRGAAMKTLWHIIDSCNIFYYFKIRAILKKIAPDVAHTNSIQGFSPFIWAIIKSCNIPLVHSMRDYYMLCHRCNMYNGKNCESLCAPCKVTNTVKKPFFRFPDHFVGISKFVLDKYESFQSSIAPKSSLIYNAIADSDFNNEPEPDNTDKITLGYIGRVEKDKGVEYLVDEVCALSKQYTGNIRLMFAGKGELEFIKHLENKLNGIECQFLGVVKPKDFFSKIDVLLVPALWQEPFGRTVIESLAHKVPVCQSDRGGLKELYDQKCSWLFSPVAGELTKVLTQILADPEQIAMKKENCRSHAKKFSSSINIDNYLNLYKKVIAADEQPQQLKQTMSAVK